MSYHFDGADHRIVSIDRVRRRRYGACGDAAAHLLAAARRQGIPAQLCIEEPPTAPDYRHVRVYLPDSNETLDPHAGLRPKLDDNGNPLGATCERLVTL